MSYDSPQSDQKTTQPNTANRTQSDANPLNPVQNSNIAPNRIPDSAKPSTISFNGELDQLIEKEARQAQINPRLLQAIIQAESNGNPKAVSKAGAIGLMQLMPKTAQQLGVNPNDPVENIRGGIDYLKNMALRYRDLDKTLAAYNAGPGNVDKYQAVPPFKETKDYIAKIRRSLFDTQA